MGLLLSDAFEEWVTLFVELSKAKDKDEQRNEIDEKIQRDMGYRARASEREENNNAAARKSGWCLLRDMTFNSSPKRETKKNDKKAGDMLSKQKAQPVLMHEDEKNKPNYTSISNLCYWLNEVRDLELFTIFFFVVCCEKTRSPAWLCLPSLGLFVRWCLSRVSCPQAKTKKHT